MTANQLILVGTSYKVASVEARERQERVFRELAPRWISQSDEIGIVATCNRFEVYRFGNAHELERSFVARGPEIYRAEGARAAEHLIRVACGIESLVLGDVQVLSQIKTARKQVRGPHIDRLFLTALRAGKRSRSETSIGSGRAGVGSAVAGMLLSRAQGDQRVLVLGAGEAAKAIGAELAKQQVGTLTWMNRTDEKAWALAKRIGGRSRRWAELETELAACDVVVAATGATEPVLSAAMLSRARPRLVVDAGMPRNVESGATVEVINIDAIREQQEQVVARRRAAIPDVEKIVAAAVDDWNRWLDARELENVLRALYADLGSSAREAAELIAQSGGDVSEIQKIVDRSMRRLLHEPVRALRALQ